MSAPLHLLYGGTFDPVHAGHLAIADGAWKALTAAGAQPLRFDWLPNADPPHRPPPGASAAQRLGLLALALQGDARFGIDTRELERDGPSWMVDTLRGLRAELGPGQPLALLLGEDAWLGFERWRDWQDIPRLAHLLVVDRPHQPGAAASARLQAFEAAHRGRLPDLLRFSAGRIVRLEVPAHPASATAVRAALQAADLATLSRWLPPRVLAEIRRAGLYGIAPGG